MFTVPAKDEAGSPWPIFEALLRSTDELSELSAMMESEITVAFMFRFGEWSSQGREILGKCYCGPSAQGDLRPLFEQLLEDTLGYYPNFLILLNGQWWEDASDLQREILVCHEALHAGHAKDKFGSPRFHRETGQPIPCIRPHDVEEFTSIAERYGPWKSDVAEFAAALARHAQPKAPSAPPADVF
jgi:hypothetical protein